MWPLVDDYLGHRSASSVTSIALALHLWATAHGLASLLIVTPELRQRGVPEFVDRALCASLHGFLNRDDAAP
jgi:hypothetical protein